jgi:hypothetical protein
MAEQAPSRVSLCFSDERQREALEPRKKHTREGRKMRRLFVVLVLVLSFGAANSAEATCAYGCGSCLDSSFRFYCSLWSHDKADCLLDATTASERSQCEDAFCEEAQESYEQYCTVFCAPSDNFCPSAIHKPGSPTKRP